MFSVLKSSFLSFFVCGIFCAAHLAHASDLQTAVQSTLTQHPSVEAALNALKIADEERREQFSAFFPELSASATAGRLFQDNSTSRGLSVTRGDAYSGFGEGSFTLRQKIFDGFETKNRVDAADSRTESASSTVADIREALSLRAVQSYINVVRARKSLKMIAAHDDKVGDYLSRIDTMVNQGASDETELQQARDIKVILEGIRADYQGQVMSAEAQFAEATGYFPPANLQDVPAMASNLPAHLDDAIQRSMNNHPGIIASRLQAEAAKHDIEAEKGTLFPDLDGELSYLQSDKRDVIGGEVTDARAVVRMNWNFSTGGAQLARIERTKHALNQSQSRIEELERQIERDIRLAHSELQTSKRQLALLKERRDLNNNLFTTYQAQFEGARVNLLQLMQAHNQVFNTELEVINGDYRHLAAQYGYLAALGKLQTSMGITAGKKSAMQKKAKISKSAQKAMPPKQQAVKIQTEPVKTQKAVAEETQEAERSYPRRKKPAMIGHSSAYERQ